MYRIQGADQKEYGPITAEQVRQWIGENRLNRFTLCAGEEGLWKPLGQFTEFADVLAVVPGAAAAGGIVPPGGGATSAGSGGASGGGGGRAEALQKVNAPALCLIALSGISAIFTLVTPFTKRAQLNFAAKLFPQAPEQVKQVWATQAAAGFGAGDIIQMVLVLLCCGVAIYGATKMRKLESFAWSIVAAVFSMVFCTGCCCGLGIAAGIWSLVVINNRDVRGHFQG